MKEKRRAYSRIQSEIPKVNGAKPVIPEIKPEKAKKTHQEIR